MLQRIFISISFLGFSACSGPSLPQQTSSSSNILGGALGGVALSKTVEGVRETITPKYPLVLAPQEICDMTRKMVVTCYLMPCDEEEGVCQYDFPRIEWIKENPKVLVIENSLVVSAMKYCNKHIDKCIRTLGRYDSKGIPIIIFP